MQAEKENGAASTGMDVTPTNEPNALQANGSDARTVSQKNDVVKWRKRSDQLRYLHFSRQISSKDMIEDIKNVHPKFDKTCLSKAENSDVYGLEICPEALKLLWNKYAPDEYQKMRRRKDGHKYANRVQCRLDDDTFKLFVAKSRADGFKTINDCLVEMIKAYTKSGDSDA